MTTKKDFNKEECIAKFSSIPQINYSSANFLPNLCQSSIERRENGFTRKLLKSWKLAAQKGGVLNYELDKKDSFVRQLPGQFGLSIQLNPDRYSKRRKPHRFEAIDQPFDGNAWNFTKLRLEECLFQLSKLASAIDSQSTKTTTALLAINASPLSVGHSLLIPNFCECLPQILTTDSIKIALEFGLILEDNRLSIIYNSLLAHASVNHLHMQILFWPIRSGLMIKKPILVASTKIQQLFLLQRPNWYLPAFAFQIMPGKNNCQQQIDKIASLAGKAVDLMISRRMAHSMFICRTTKFEIIEDGIEDEIEIKTATINDDDDELLTLFLFPRRPFDEALEEGSPFSKAFVPAALEVAGLIPVYDDKFFESTSEEEIIQIFDKYSLISDEQFGELADKLIEHLDEY